jgi:hypothetical protein
MLGVAVLHQDGGKPRKARAPQLLDVTNGVQIGEVNGNNELYDPITNTVYISSQYGSDITPGAKPGTFVYTEPKLQRAPLGSGQHKRMPIGRRR